METHPDLFQKAMDYERDDELTGERYTWVQGESLAELARPERVAQIKRDFEVRTAKKMVQIADRPLSNVFAAEADDDPSGCTICHL